jgi:hypothetical protein
MTSQEARLIPTSELKTRIHYFRQNKIWQGDYFVINAEVQRRATASWVHEDVFGEPYEWDVKLQKFFVPKAVR